MSAVRSRPTPPKSRKPIGDANGFSLFGARQRAISDAEGIAWLCCRTPTNLPNHPLLLLLRALRIIFTFRQRAISDAEGIAWLCCRTPTNLPNHPLLLLLRALRIIFTFRQRATSDAAGITWLCCWSFFCYIIRKNTLPRNYRILISLF